MPMDVMAQNLMSFNQSAQANSTEAKKGPPVVLKNLTQPEEVNFRDLLSGRQEKGGQAQKLEGFKQLLELLKLSPEEMKQKLQTLSKEELQALDETSQMALFNLLNLLQQVDKKPELSLKDSGISREGLQQLKEKLTTLQQFLNKMEFSNSNKSSTQSVSGNKGTANNKASNISNTDNNKSSNTSQNRISQGNKVSVQTEELRGSSKGEEQSQPGNNSSDINRVKISGSIDQSNIKGKTVKAKTDSGLAVKLNNKADMSSRNKVNDFTLTNRDIQAKMKAADNQEAKLDPADLAQKLKTGQAEDFSSGQTKKELLSQLKSSAELKEMAARFNNQSKGLQQNTIINNNSQNSSFQHSNQFSNGQQFNFTFNQTGAENVSSGQGRPDILAAFGTENPVDQIMDQLQRLQKSGQKGLKLQLEPEFLGKVNLDLKVNSGDVTARLVVDNILVKNHLDQNISLLKNNLVNQGFNVENLEIETNNNGSNLQQDGNGEQFDQQQYNNQNQNRNFGFKKNPYQELEELDPEQLKEIAEMRPQQLQNWEMANRHNWLTLSGYYQQMNILA